MATFTPNKNLTRPANGAPAWDTPVNLDWDMIDTAFGGVQQINLGGQSGVITLTNTFPIVATPLTSMSHIPAILICSGALAGNTIIKFPAAVSGHWIIGNYVTSGAGGPYTLTVAPFTAGGSTFSPPVGALSHFYADPANVIPVGSVAQASQVAMIGEVKLFASPYIPTSWLVCAGQSLLIATYPALYAALASGGVYGQADGTHFNLPDLRGRVPAGADNMGGGAAPGRLPGWVLGTNGGIWQQSIAIGHMPTHDHGGGDHLHGAYQDGHQHLIPEYVITGTGANVAAGSGWGIAPNQGTNFVDPVPGVHVNTSGATIGAQGSGVPFPIVQPTLGLNYIIYTGV